MRDTKPLNPVPPGDGEPAPPVTAAQAVAPSEPRPAAPGPKPALAPNASLDRRTDERLRRGRLSIQARLDLHGMTQAEAHAALNGFVQRSQAAGRRAILIITGKGALTAGGGVLRRAVPRWLHEPPLRELVLAVREAQPKDGGEGALYVLLRKPRGRPA
jgi:DNA-nicking Smr family endonuclease